MTSPLLRHLYRWSRQTAGAPLFLFPAGDGREPISYGAAALTAGRLAAELAARGLGTGDRLVARTPTSPETVLLCLATQWAGGVFVPLNPALSEREAALLTGDAEPAVVVEGDHALTELFVAAGDRGAVDSLVEPVARSAEDPAAIIYTSGTTGRPKGAVVSHGNLASNAEALHRVWGFGRGDVTVHALPTFHAHGLFVAVNTALVNGSPLLFLGRFDADRVIDALAGAGTVLMGVPTFYVRLLASARFTRDVAAGVRLFISGSAPLTEAVFAAFEERTGQRILERYGMSETEMIASNPLDGERVAGSVGFALPDVELRIRRGDDPAMPLAATGEVGGIEVRGPNVFDGYWKLPERRAVDFTADGWFRTGDLGTLDGDGRLRIVGRSKDLIISGGENVYPKEIELLLDRMPGVLESAVVGMADEDFGELGLAVVVPERRADVAAVEPEPAALLAALGAELARFKVPRAVVFVDELPRNAMGKVQKAALQERFGATWPELRDAGRTAKRGGPP